MKCRKLLVVLNKDYSDDKTVIRKLKSFLGELEGLYYVDMHENAVSYLVNVDYLNSIVGKLDNGPYETVCRSATEAKEYLIILKPTDRSFKELDDRRLTEMFSV